MNNFDEILKIGTETASLDENQLTFLLEEQNPDNIHKLFAAANAVKLKNIGNKVSLRGLIEIGNICRKNCFYCGIRRENSNIERFELSQNEILADAEMAWKFNYGSIVLQGGEIQTEKHIAFIEDTVRKIKSLSNNELGITLSLGEQSLETYKRWFKAGAHRYLLRVETSDSEIYSRIHPADHLYSERLQALYHLREAGFQLGSGVMFGFDGQTYRDMARDLLFLKKLDVDMVGMGPYSVHKDTPMGKNHSPQNNAEMLTLGCKMIALLRLIMPDINIASTTVLQALAADGREQGLLAGANVIMPNVSEVRFRKAYQLYDNKPGVDENADVSRNALEQSLFRIGLVPAYNEWGDSEHFAKRCGKICLCSFREKCIFMKKCYTNVRLIDGRNFFGESKNVVVENDIITDFSDFVPPNTDVIDGENKHLSPSWIDVHGHSDLSVFELDDGGSRRSGGFGIEIAGNCGLSPFPVTDMNRENLAKVYENFHTSLTWQSYGDYCTELRKKAHGFELFSFCGHNSLHAAVMGYDEKKPTADDLKKMTSLLSETLEQGALGLSLGLLYSPGRFATENELETLFKCCAEHEKIVSAHLRSEGDFLLESITEMFELCRRSGLHDFHISHLKTAKAENFHKIDALFALLDRAEKDYGVNVTFDRYPFTQSMSQLSIIGPEKYLSVPDRIITERLKNPVEKADFFKYLADLPPEKWTKTILAKCRQEKFRKFCGMTFADISTMIGASPAEIALEMLAEDSVGTCAAFDTLSKENMLRIICDDRCFCGSDETAVKVDGQWLLPRNQFSGFRSIELQLENNISLGDIICKLTHRAAERFKLPVTSELRIGSRADFTIF